MKNMSFLAHISVIELYPFSYRILMQNMLLENLFDEDY